MSLHHHVANKEVVLDGIVEVVFSKIELPPGYHFGDGFEFRLELILEGLATPGSAG